MKTADFASSITADAKKQAAKIEREAKAEFAKVDAETEKLVAARRAKLEAQVRAQEARERHRLEAKHHLDETIAILTCKHELIDDVFTKAASTLEKLSGKEREQVLDKLFADASKQTTIGSIQAVKQDEQFLQGKATVEKTIPGIGGFIARSEDGKVLVDMRFETILETIRQQHATAIAEVLFGGKAA